MKKQAMKTVSENKILDTLTKGGGKIRWNTIIAKAYLLSATDEVLGVIRFDTYLKITGYGQIVYTGSDYSCQYYGFKAR
jgi:hypothetical protein